MALYKCVSIFEIGVTFANRQLLDDNVAHKIAFKNYNTKGLKVARKQP